MKKGITFLEILIVIAIMGILAVLVISVTAKRQKEGRDSRRKSDIDYFYKNLVAYKIAFGDFPANIGELVSKERFTEPKDPKDPHYQYIYEYDNSVNPARVKICAYLESTNQVWCWTSETERSLAYSLDNPIVPSDFDNQTGSVISAGGAGTGSEGGSGGSTSESQSNWIECATEGQQCVFAGTKLVRYGIAGLYNEGNYTEVVACNNSVFDDPAWGFSKKCYYKANPFTATTGYAVRPVIFLASDSNVGDENTYKSTVDSSFNDVKSWYSEQLGGKTFNLESAILYRSTKTYSELQNLYVPFNSAIWYKGLKNVLAENGLDACDTKRNYYFITPMVGQSGNEIFGGMVGAENMGCNYVLPGTQSIPGHMGEMIGGIIDPAWSEWFANENREARGGVAHELGHGFGGTCTNGNVYPGGACGGLAHSDYPSIMFAWWDYRASTNPAVFLENEKTAILQSPFIQ